MASKSPLAFQASHIVPPGVRLSYSRQGDKNKHTQQRHAGNFTDRTSADFGGQTKLKEASN